MKKRWPIIVLERWPIIVLILVLVVVLFATFCLKNNPSNNPPPQRTNSAANSNPPPPPNSQNASAVSSSGVPVVSNAPNEIASRAASLNPPSNSVAETNESANLPPLTVLDKARILIHNYRSAFSQNPVGNNAEITAALGGKNLKQINFVADSGLRVNEKGEMVDAYGTPFFFHQISGQEMEIRSAGEDRIMWTFDDLVTK